MVGKNCRESNHLSRLFRVEINVDAENEKVRLHVDSVDERVTDVGMRSHGPKCPIRKRGRIPFLTRVPWAETLFKVNVSFSSIEE